MGLSIRQVGPEDLPAAVRLFEIRDGHSYDPERIAHVVGRFEPARGLAWMAFDGDQPVGLTMMLLRELEVDRQRVRSGYWAHLYVRPEYRQYLLYPRLTLAMTGALRRNNLAVLYTGVRFPEVAQAHVNLGFVKLGEVTVRAKPLRPARLLARYKAWRICEQFADLPDFLYRGVLRLRSPRWKGPQAYERSPDLDLAEFVPLLNLSQCRVRQVWSVSRLQERYAGNLDGEPYALLGVRRQGMLAAAALWRMAVRDNDVRSGVLMDLAFQAGEEHAARAVLAAAEWDALRAGCDVMLHLDGHSESSRLINATGYWPSPARYTILLWPPKAVQNGVLADLEGWRYAFGDHDAP